MASSIRVAVIGLADPAWNILTGLRSTSGLKLVGLADADEERYFGHFAPEAVFLGTDAGERWTVEEFRAFAHPHFSEGRGWTYLPRDRRIMFSPDGGMAWFDERLHSEKYGELRGTGVLRLIGSDWKLLHYSMTFTIPNDRAREVVALIRE